MLRLRSYLRTLLRSGVVWRKQLDRQEATIRLRQPLIVVLVFIVTGWYLAAPSPAIAISLVFFAGLLAASAVWAAEMARKVSAARHLETSAMQVGDELEEYVFLSNRSSLPLLWVEIVDRSDLPGYTVAGVRAVGAKAETSWRARTICTQRGVYTLGPWELRTSDPFGLFSVEQVYSQPQQILVYPPLAALPAELLPHRGAQGDHRPLNQPVAAETADGMTVREYTMGDPLHHIHWRTTARRSEPFVKVFEPEASSRIWILPDMDSRVLAGEGGDSSAETAVMLAASLAARLLQDKILVGLFGNGETPDLVLPRRGKEQLWLLLESLARLRTSPRQNLAETLERIHPLISPRDLLIVITSSLDPGWMSVLERNAHSRAGGSAEVILLEPGSFGAADALDAVEGLIRALNSRGFQARMVRKGEIQPLNAVYGALSRWEFSVSATGKAIVRSSPRRSADAPGSPWSRW